MRKDEGLKTRVKIGRSDFILRTRDPDSAVWTTRQLPYNLPDFEEHLKSSYTPGENSQ